MSEPRAPYRVTATKRRPAQPLLRPALRVLYAAVELARRGAVIRAARLLPSPAVVIDEPPPGLLTTFAYRYAADRPARPCQGCARATNGVPILWAVTAPRTPFRSL